MRKNGVLDIFCKIISVLLSIVFVIAILVTALFYSITNVLKPETLTEIITDIDYSEMLSGAVIEATDKKPATISFRPALLMSSATTVIGGADSGTSIVVESSGNSGSQVEDILGSVSENFSEEELRIIESFMESDVAKQVLDEYASVVSDVLSGKEAKLNKEKIKQIITDNKDELIAFIEENLGEAQVDKEEISQGIDKFLNENLDELLEVMPEPEEIVSAFPPEVIEILNIINSGVILNALLTFDAILALVIFILRLWDFAGFLWLGVNGIVSGVILTLIYFVVCLFGRLFLDTLTSGQAIVNSVFSMITSRMLMCIGAILIGAIVLMIIFFIIKKIRRK